MVLGSETLTDFDAPAQRSLDAATLESPGFPDPRFLREPPVLGVCDAASRNSRDLEIEAVVTLASVTCDTGPCDLLGVQALQPLADESVWVLMMDGGFPDQLVRLAHYDAHGAELGHVDATASDSTFAVADDGTAWLLASGDSERTLQRFDVAAHPVGAKISVAEEVESIAVLTGQGILLAAPGIPASVTLLDLNGTFVWTKPASRDSDMVKLAVGTERYALFGATQREPSYTGVTVSMFSADGGVLWSTESKVNLETGAFQYYFSAGIDQHDNVTIAVDPPKAAKEAFERADYLDLERIGVDGESDWDFRMRGHLPGVGTLVSPEGDIYAAAYPVGSDDSVALDRLSPDGEHCLRMIDRDHAFHPTRLALSPNGRVWFAAMQPSGAPFVGRLGATRP